MHSCTLCAFIYTFPLHFHNLQPTQSLDLQCSVCWCGHKELWHPAGRHYQKNTTWPKTSNFNDIKETPSYYRASRLLLFFSLVVRWELIKHFSSRGFDQRQLVLFRRLLSSFLPSLPHIFRGDTWNAMFSFYTPHSLRTIHFTKILHLFHTPSLLSSAPTPLRTRYSSDTLPAVCRTEWFWWTCACFLWSLFMFCFCYL